METSKDPKKEFPSVTDRACTQYKKHRKVKEIMTREIVTIAPENTLDDAAKMMGEKHIGSLIVLKYGTPVGVITERDLLTKAVGGGVDLEKDWLVGGVSLKEVKVERVMSYPLVTIGSTAKIEEAARMMIEKRIRRLAVFEGGQLVGIITASDLIRSLPQVPETMRTLFQIEYFMNKKIITADEKTSVGQVAKIMGEKRIGSIIITSQGEPIGIFTERDLLTEFLAKDKPLTIEVGKSCSSPLITASIGISVYDAAITMTKKHIRRLPITREGKLVGIVTARDLVEAYAARPRRA